MMHPFLASLINYEKGLLKYQMDHFDPTRVGKMLEDAGYTYEGKKIFHIAGTKGKGSTAIYLARLLRQVYSRVGLYTSPHLLHVEERIQINGVPIASEVLEEVLTRWRGLIERYGCSFFEALTFLGMAYFLEEGCEAIVLETGMGGRLDATNFLLSPTACIITRIGWDHTKFLGNTLAEIAREKAGIIKEGVKVFSSPQEKEAEEVLEKTAREKKAPLLFVRPVYHLVSATKEKWIYLFPDGGLWETTQWGEVFVQNFLLACEVLQGVGIMVSDEHKRKAFHKPLPFRMWYSPPFLFDVAHNPESFLSLFHALAHIPGEKDLYIGILAEKELSRLVPCIVSYRSLFERVVCFDFPSPRPSGGRELAHLLGEEAEYLPDIPIIQDRERLSVVTGSFYWAEEFMKRYGIPWVFAQDEL
ncbi:MAG: Mur ligase family protein [Brevinematales bacterium]|nr:Mur ligase family protein [Brevinematales bacterium]